MARSESKNPDPEVPAKATRRTFSAEYKRRILAAADQLTADGEKHGHLLRKEGLYRRIGISNLEKRLLGEPSSA